MAQQRTDRCGALWPLSLTANSQAVAEELVRRPQIVADQQRGRADCDGRGSSGQKWTLTAKLTVRQRPARLYTITAATNEGHSADAVRRHENGDRS
jgi:hypothetical protein